MASFTFYQYDIIWILETNPEKKITFLTHLLKPQLSREDCFECIKSVLNDNDLPVPEWSIKKQLSSWNKYLSTLGNKGSKPIYLYDHYRERSEGLFKLWVIDRYLQEFKKHHHRIVEPEKEFHGDDVLEQAANEYSIDPMDEICDDMDKTAKTDLLDAICKKKRVLPTAIFSRLIDNEIVSENKRDLYVKKKKRHKKR